MLLIAGSASTQDVFSKALPNAAASRLVPGARDVYALRATSGKRPSRHSAGGQASVLRGEQEQYGSGYAPRCELSVKEGYVLVVTRTLRFGAYILTAGTCASADSDIWQVAARDISR